MKETIIAISISLLPLYHIAIVLSAGAP